MQKELSVSFFIVGLLALLAGLCMGLLGATQFLFPETLQEILPFYKVRPIHVSLVVAWLFLAITGGLYHYMPQITGKSLPFPILGRLHYLVFTLGGVVVILSYFLGNFGGREYWAFPPVLGFIILTAWLLFGINFFSWIKGYKKTWPVYLWMWSTGLIFFTYTFIESYLYLWPYFAQDIIGDIQVQWKSMGSLVGSWNMLIYGTAIYLMSRIDKKSNPYSKTAMFLYFLGLTNLILGWAHHIYQLPSGGWIRYLAYMISMTELLVLAHLIWEFIKNMKSSGANWSFMPYRFLFATEIWILVNLVLAIAISIPAINLFTHGTHVTVAHAMGTTIGINTMILLASIFYVCSEQKELKGHRSLNAAFWIINGSLLVFWCSLVHAGVVKGYYRTYTDLPFQQIMENLKEVMGLFLFAGFGLLLGFVLLIIPTIKLLLARSED